MVQRKMRLHAYVLDEGVKDVSMAPTGEVRVSVVATSLSDVSAPVAAELEAARVRFDEEIQSGRPFVNALCDQVKRYRGKMLRPMLLLLTGKATLDTLGPRSGRVCQGLTDEHVTLAAVVEMVHVATLVHDDVLDEADVRRQRRTVNAMSGNEAAVLLGDYLISHAFHLCSSLASQYASREIGATTNRVCEGELSQIHHRGDAQLTEEQYLDIIQSKTASLTGACCALGARFAGADEATVEQMRQFGTELGTAFQIIDDLLDLTGSEAKLGKTLGRDLDLGKPTLPVIHGLVHGGPALRHRLEELIRGDGAAGRDGVPDLLRRSGSTEYAGAVARRFIDAAAARLQGLPESPARSSLAVLTDFVLHRDH